MADGQGESNFRVILNIALMSIQGIFICLTAEAVVGLMRHNLSDRGQSIQCASPCMNPTQTRAVAYR